VGDKRASLLYYSEMFYSTFPCSCDERPPFTNFHRFICFNSVVIFGKMVYSVLRRHDTKLNDAQLNDTQHNGTYYSETQLS
jgi:hypothetical protein